MKPINTIKDCTLDTKRRFIYTYSRIAIPILINSSEPRAFKNAINKL